MATGTGIAMITQAKKSTKAAAVDGVKKGVVNVAGGAAASAAASASSATGDNHDNNNNQDMDYNQDEIVDSSSSSSCGNDASVAAAAPAAPVDTLRSVYTAVRVQLQTNQVLRTLRL